MHKNVNQFINMKQFVTFFFPKKIVWAQGFPKGVLLKGAEINGKKYLTIAVTNVAINAGKNEALVYHVPIKKVLGIQRSITPFQRWFYSKVNKPLPSYPIKSLKN